MLRTLRKLQKGVSRPTRDALSLFIALVLALALLVAGSGLIDPAPTPHCPCSPCACRR